MTARSLPHAPRRADCVEPGPGATLDDSPAARDHALALLAASPVYARVACLLGQDGTNPLTAARTEIGVRLAQLPAGWHVVSAAGVDHLIVGPGGVFAVCVQHHPDAAVTVVGDNLKVNGRSRRRAGDVRRRTLRLQKSLAGVLGQPLTIRAVLAVSGAERGFVVQRQPRDVTVVSRRTITPFLHAQPAVLDPKQVERIVAGLSHAAEAR